MQNQDELKPLKAQIDSLKEKKRNLTIRFVTELAALDEELNQKMEEYYRLLSGVGYNLPAPSVPLWNSHPTADAANYGDSSELNGRVPFQALHSDARSLYQRPYFNVEKDIVPKVEQFLQELGRPATKNEIVEHLKKEHNIAYKNPFIILKKCEQASQHIEKIGRALYKYSEQKEAKRTQPEQQNKNSSFKTEVLPLIIEIMREKKQPVTGKEIFQALEQKHQLVYLNYTLTMNRVIRLDNRVRKVDRDLYVFEEE